MAEADVLLFVLEPGGAAPQRSRGGRCAAAIAEAGDRGRQQGGPPAGGEAIGEFFSLGLGEPFRSPRSTGGAIGDLLDAVVALFPEEEAGDESVGGIRVAVIGRPNVGKSSLVNRLIGEERSIVSEIPGTTRDAIDTTIERGGSRFTLIDTAGIRRRSRIDEAVERYSVMRALRAIDRGTVCVDADSTGPRGSPSRTSGSAVTPTRPGKAIILVVNKWDLVEKDEKTMDHFEERSAASSAFVQYAPILFVSAKTGQRVHRLLELIEYVAEPACPPHLHGPAQRSAAGGGEPSPAPIRQRRAPQGVLHHPDRGAAAHVCPLRERPPSDALFVRAVSSRTSSGRHFGFVGTPIVFSLRKRA